MLLYLEIFPGNNEILGKSSKGYEGVLLDSFHLKYSIPMVDIESWGGLYELLYYQTSSLLEIAIVTYDRRDCCINIRESMNDLLRWLFIWNTRI